MRAKRKLDRISLLVRPKVTAVRDGVETVIDQSEIVMDDLIVMRACEQAIVDRVGAEIARQKDELHRENACGR